MPLEFRDQRLDQATEQGELVSRAMGRLCCYQCGDAGGMQAYDEDATRALPPEQQTGYWKYLGPGSEGIVFRPCPVCRRTDVTGVSIRYEEWTP